MYVSFAETEGYACLKYVNTSRYLLAQTYSYFGSKKHDYQIIMMSRDVLNVKNVSPKQRVRDKIRG